MKKKSFIIFGGAELPWIYPLGVGLSQFGPTTLIRLGASTSFVSMKAAWPFEDTTENLDRLWWNYPPGFNGKFSWLFTQFVRSRLAKVIAHHRDQSGDFPFIITTYPKFFPYLDDVDPSRLIYLNYDDLSVRHGSNRFFHLPQEDALASRANIILCSSRFQAHRFRERWNGKKRCVFHLPHGVHDKFINPNPLASPNVNSVCVVGSLSSRYDWNLIYDVIVQLPLIKIIFIGDFDQNSLNGEKAEWFQWLQKVLKLPNVIHIKGMKYRETAKYFWQNAVNWIPYKTEVAFVKASCPLKLMDGLASGRPVISADVPECRLYPEWVSIYRDSSEAVELLQSTLRKVGSTKAMERAREQVGFARRNTWTERATRLNEILNSGKN